MKLKAFCLQDKVRRLKALLAAMYAGFLDPIASGSVRRHSSAADE